MRFVRALTILMTVMVLAPNSWAGTEKVLHNFLGGSDGSEPADVGRLARDKSGNLYGTTQGGGTCGRGTVFQLSKSHGDWTETVLYSFCGSDGDNPVAGVILDSSDNIYGTTKFGGGLRYSLQAFQFNADQLVQLYLRERWRNARRRCDPR